MFDILEKIKKDEINIAQLARDTRIPADRIYKWKDRGSKITLEDALELQKWAANGLDNSTDTNSKQPGPAPELPVTKIFEAIQELALSVYRIENKIEKVFPGETDSLFDVVHKAIQNKDTGTKKGRSDKQG